jgi:predicted unusual protein kinase regulating ubiquinone biosynthesis (AarF/ABC1/UbiB family)
MFRTIYNYYKISNLINNLYNGYLQNNSIDELNIIKLYDIVRNSGCVCIKFFQWILPLIEINFKDVPSWFKILEKIYDNCIIHDKEYTLEIFKKEHGYDFNERYELQYVIASGSIGQVYRIREKYTDKILALKVLHPNVSNDIWYFKIFSKILLWIPRYNQLLLKYIPINISGFIDEFNEQTDMINESKNMNMFLESFSDSLHIYKIPKPISYTKNTLIMTYESSTKFEDLECSEYIRSKIIRFLAIFFWNSHLHNICHEDIHKGNWGVQLNDNKIKLVIYDYGLCTRMLGEKVVLFELLHNIFVDNGDTNKDIDDKILDNLKDLIQMCVNDIEKEIVSEYIENIFKNKSLLIPDAKVYVKMLFECAKINEKLVDTSLLKIILVYSQLQKFIDEYYGVVQYPEQEINQSDSYRISIPDNYSLCKTENICEFYRNDCLKKLDTKNESYDSVFLFTSENIKNNHEILKNMIKETNIKN